MPETNNKMAPDPFGEEGQATHEAILESVAEADARSVTLAGARAALALGVDPDLLPELYGVTAEEARAGGAGVSGA